MYALLIALIVLLFIMVKTKETFILKIGNPFKDQDLVALESQKPGTRVVATTPDTCPSGQENDAGLCYPLCRPGFYGIGPTCFAETANVGVGKPVGLETCHLGWQENGLICVEPVRWDSCKSKFFGLCVGGIRGGRWQGRMNQGGICNYDTDDRRGKLPSWLVDSTWQATHPVKVAGLCYKRCPEDKPNRVPGMPYLCMKGTELTYGRGVGKIPPLIAFGDDSPSDSPAGPVKFSCDD